MTRNIKPNKISFNSIEDRDKALKVLIYDSPDGYSRIQGRLEY
jgi:hypothetical protein